MTCSGGLVLSPSHSSTGNSGPLETCSSHDRLVASPWIQMIGNNGTTLSGVTQYFVVVCLSPQPSPPWGSKELAFPLFVFCSVQQLVFESQMKLKSCGEISVACLLPKHLPWHCLNNIYSQSEDFCLPRISLIFHSWYNYVVLSWITADFLLNYSYPDRFLIRCHGKTSSYWQCWGLNLHPVVTSKELHPFHGKITHITHLIWLSEYVIMYKNRLKYILTCRNKC